VNDAGLPAATMVDAVFPLEGRSLPRDHRLALAGALATVAPWLPDLARAGLHPVNLVHGGADPALLSHRARLVLRVPRSHADALHALDGAELDVAGHRVRLGTPHLRDLLPHNTLYAHFVAADLVGDGDDEVAFVAAIDAELDALGASCRRICGRRQRIRGGDDTLVGYSLMLHGLAAPGALRVLETGVGRHRWLGAGLFVPHRSAAAVVT
jgi:CRISPR-associated protein Cas6